MAWSTIIELVSFIVGTSIVSIIMACALIIYVPETYFLESHHHQSWCSNRHPILKWGWFIFKNIIGLILIGFGIVLLVTPGQGLLTILCGIVLVDFPGKRSVELKIIRRPKIISAANRLRAFFKKPPIKINP